VGDVRRRGVSVVIAGAQGQVLKEAAAEELRPERIPALDVTHRRRAAGSAARRGAAKPEGGNCAAKRPGA
jgi:hypothetical protein